MTTLRARADDVMWQEVDNELIVLDSKRSVYIRVSGSGPVLWPLLVDGASREQLAAKLVEEFGIDTADAIGDVEDFLSELLRQQLIVEDA